MNPPNPLNPPVHLRLIPPSPRSPVLPTSSPPLIGPELDQEFPAPAMAGDTQLSEAEKKKAQEADQRLTKLIQKLDTLMEMYPVDFYDGRVLAANKEKWLGKIEDALQEFLQEVMEFDENWYETDEAKKEAKKVITAVKKAAMDYILAFNMKIVELTDNRSAPSSTNSSAAGSSSLPSGPTSSDVQAKKNAEVNVKIDGKKVNAEVKLLSEEINKTDWEEADNHVIETGMKSI